MIRKMTLPLTLVIGVLVMTHQSEAQFFYPFGVGLDGAGWGGWSSTAYGDIARGMGMYAAGAGVYNYQTAKANAIDHDTLIRFNEYLFQSQQLANQRYARLQAERTQRRNEAFNAIQTRLRENPTPNDIFRGDAMNALLDQLTNPRLVNGSSYSRADQSVPGRIIRAIPFFYASDAVTISLDRLTKDESWPRVLRSDTFKAEREAFTQAIKVVVTEDEDGDPKPADVAKVREALRVLYEKVKATIPVTQRPDHLNAIHYLKGLAGLARMLDQPKFQKALEDLDPAKQATVGQLLSFMQNYNLRFGVASSPEQRKAYQELFTMMFSQRAKLLGNSKEVEVPADIHGSPSELFKNVEEKDLIPTSSR